MNTLVLLLLVLGAAFAVVLSIRAHSDLDTVMRELSKINARIATTEADHAMLAQKVGALCLAPTETDRQDPRVESARSNGSHQADPRVYVQRVPDQPHDRVILSNRSGAAAHDLTLDLHCPGGLTPFLPEFADQNFPVEVLNQGVPYIVLASFRGQCWPPVDARLEWRDPDGTRQVREFPLHW